MTHRPHRSALLSALAVGALGLSLAACASTGPGDGTYTQRLDKLRADCDARGGILTPTGAQSASPEVDYACQINGLPSSRTR